MNRLPAAAFAVLAIATVGAFFVSQHLKVTNPLVNGLPRADPAAINPLAGRICVDAAGRRVSFRRTRVGFYLQARADTVLVYVINSAGEIVANATGSGRYLRPGPHHYAFFGWNGRVSGGRVAPDGAYTFRVALQSENRTFTLTNGPTPVAVQVITSPPRPRVTRVRVAGQTASAPAVIAPVRAGAASPVTIDYTKGSYRGATLQVYRTDPVPPTPARPVFSFGINGHRGTATWNGLIRGQPAPAGTYLVGISVTDQACNPGSFPAATAPAPGTTPHAGVSVRYLAAEPPLTPVGAGSRATVYVDSEQHPFSWALRLPGALKVLAHGSGSGRSVAGQPPTVSVRVPALGAQLYELSIRSDGHRTVVPLVAAAQGRRAEARVLVVVPALEWAGENPVDSDGDGLPDTLAAGQRIALDRVFASFPPDFADEAAVLAYLSRQHRAYQLTTDIALAEGAGPRLAGHTGVILAGAEHWLPAGLGPALRAFVAGGGRLLSIGPGALHRTAPLSSAGGVASAGPPSGPTATDPFGATTGNPVTGNHFPLLVIADRLGLFGSTSGTFGGFTSYQAVTPPQGATAVSAAGTSSSNPAITGFRVGRGTVVEIGLAGFGASLAHDLDTEALLGRLWQILSG